MNSRWKKGVCLTILALIFAPLPMTANQQESSGLGPVLKRVQKRICSNFVPMSEDYPYPEAMSALIRFSSSGKIEGVKLSFIRKDPETAFSFMEAIYSSSPLPPFEVFVYGPNGRVQVKETDVSIDGKAIFQTSLGHAKPQVGGMGQSVEKYHPRAKLDIHLIPLDVLNRYPGLFSRAELLAPENTLALPKETLVLYPDNFHPVASKKVMAFFQAWESFFIDHPKSPTRAQVLALRVRAKAALVANAQH